MIDRAGSPSAGAPIASSASRQAAGPAPQLTPTASAPAAASAAAAAAGLLPSARTSSSPNVSEAMTGTSEARRASSTARTQLLQVRERLEDDQVRPALEQALDLLAERGPGGGLGEDRPAPRRRPERPDRAADERVAPADLACLAGELRRTPVDRADLALEAPGRQTLPVGAERQGLDQLGARLEVLAMGGPDHLRMGRDELLETGPLRHAAAEQQRPQAAVDQERAGGETASEALSRRADGRGVGHRSPIEWVGRAAGPEMTRPFLLGRVSKGVPLSCRRTCPDLAPCRLDAGRLSWLQRAGPSATLDKNLFGCGAMVPHASRDEQGGRPTRQAADVTRSRSRYAARQRSVTSTALNV